MIDLSKIDDLAKRLAGALPAGAQQMREDAEVQFRAVLHKTLSSMDVVTREDYEIQKAALERAQEKLQRLEDRLSRLEQA